MITKREKGGLMKTKYTQSTHNPFNSQGKMFHHADKIDAYKKGYNAAPILIEVNLTNQCPLKCKWCISSYSHKNEKLDTEELLKFLKEYKRAGGKAVTWSGGGEPTSHPSFDFILIKTAKIGLEQGLMTNGLYPKYYNRYIEQYCTWVRYSVDTCDAVRYCELKGVDALNKVTENIKDINKSAVKVGINMNLPQEPNYDMEIDALWDFAADLNVKYFQIRPVLPRYYEKESVNHKYLREQIDYLKNIDGQTRENTGLTVSWDKFYDLAKDNNGRTYHKCRGHHFECVLNANGDLTACMYHLNNPKFVFGNIYRDSFNVIWKSDKRKKVIEHCDNLDFDKCQICCKCHEINKLLDYIDNDREDVNFI